MLPSHLFMWPNLMLYFGPLQHLETRSNGASVLMIGLYREFDLRVDGGEPQACRCAVVPAGVPHEVDVHGGVLAKLFVERDSDEYGRFQQRFPLAPGQRAVRVQDAALVEEFMRLYEEAPAKDDMLKALLALMPAPEAPGEDAAGRRLAPVFDLLRQQGDENHGRDRAAGVAHLSASRMMHLFRAETGMSYRGFRIWKRLILAAEHLQRTDCLTRSAVDAGFADASHFSNCYKRYIGASPSLVFRSLQRFER